MFRNPTLAAFVALLLILVGVYNVHFFRSRAGKHTAAPAPGQVAERTPDTAAAPLKAAAPYRPIAEKADTAAWKRNPFGVAPQKASNRRNAYVLSGILNRTGKGLAIINGSVVTTGDRIGDSVVEGISRDRVIMRSHGEKQILILDGERDTAVKEKRR